MADESKADGTMAAVVCSAKGDINNFAVGTAPKPTAGAGEVLVKVKTTGLNPVDWKMAVYGFFVSSYPCVVGCDFAGEVVALGEGVTDFAVGDAVFGYTQLGRPGTQAEFAVAEARWIFKKPEDLAWAVAATAAVAAMTPALCLWGPTGMGMPGTIAKPATDSPFLLVWGGSTTVGLNATQFATAAGYRVVSVCSKKNHELATSFGAAFTVDYHDEDAKEQIAKIVGGDLKYAVDAANGKSAAICASLITATAEAPGHLAFVSEGPEGGAPDNVKPHFINLGMSYSSDVDREFLVPFFRDTVLPAYTAGTLKTIPVREIEGGLEGVVVGLKELQSGKVSAQKLAVTL